MVLYGVHGNGAMETNDGSLNARGFQFGEETQTALPGVLRHTAGAVNARHPERGDVDAVVTFVIEEEHVVVSDTGSLSNALKVSHLGPAGNVDVGYPILERRAVVKLKQLHQLVGPLTPVRSTGYGYLCPSLSKRFGGLGNQSHRLTRRGIDCNLRARSVLYGFRRHILFERRTGNHVELREPYGVVQIVND